MIEGDRWSKMDLFETYRNQYLSDLMYKTMSEPTVFDVYLTPARIPWYRRLWWRIEPWVPHVHLGPCDHTYCE